MSDRIAEIEVFLEKDNQAAFVGNLWDKHRNEMQEIRSAWSETDKYIFATDTTTTANKALPWTHTSTLPKLTNIRDNLHANYLSSLFPHDKWLTWVAYSADAAKKEVAKVMTSYMENKTREGKFRGTVSRLLYDYIDKGVAFGMPSFEVRYKTTEDERVTDFIGPKAVRISPYDIVFDATAVDFDSTWKIVRSIKSIGELKKLAETEPSQRFWMEALERRQEFQNRFGGITRDDWEKASQYEVDGFGSLFQYYNSNSVEILEFYGDCYHPDTGEVMENKMITVIDRTTVVRSEDIQTYGGRAPIRMVGWRLRPDNLWAMGPLDNLVGLQYRLDHLENMKANAIDLVVMPPIKIMGDVEEFNYGPNEEIHIDEKGDVQPFDRSLNSIFSASDEISQIEQRMEMYAGAPREAMGVRTAGEKTAFEVQALENAAGRIFQEKIIQFEIFMEELLNDMLESAHRNFDQSDVIRVVDADIGVTQFREVSKDDITANGILRPVGARHFAQQAQELQNLVGIFNSPIGPMVAPHTSGIAMTKFIEDVVNLRGYELFTPNIAISEQQETQQLVNQSSEDGIMAEQESEEELLNSPEALELAEEEAQGEDIPS